MEFVPVAVWLVTMNNLMQGELRPRGDSDLEEFTTQNDNCSMLLVRAPATNCDYRVAPASEFLDDYGSEPLTH